MVTSARAMLFDTDHLRAVGIEPERNRLTVLNSAIAWRARFEPVAAGAIYVDTPGFNDRKIRSKSARKFVGSGGPTGP